MASKIRFGFGDQLILAALVALICLKFLSFQIFLALFALFGIVWIHSIHRKKQHWRTIGVPGPEVNIFLGNVPDLIRKGIIGMDQEHFAKFGKTFGTYTFGRNELCTMDPQMIRAIFIKEFPKFQNRFDATLLDVGSDDGKDTNLFQHTMVFKKDENWKRIRSLVTPAFTTGKLKRLIPILLESTERMCESIEKQHVDRGREIPLKDLSSRLMLEVIGRAGFSLELNVFQDDDNVFVKHTKQIFTQRQRSLMVAMMDSNPFLLYLASKFVLKAEKNAQQFYYDLMSDLYEKRRADPEAKEKFADIFQLLINAVEEGEGANWKDGKVEEADREIVHRELLEGEQGRAEGGSRKSMSPVELFAQSFILFVAGYDTTGTTLHFALYMLAMFPEVQDRLREEINEIVGEEKLIGYEHLRRMHYLQAVVKETLRMYPPALKINRECGRDTEINGISLKQGDLITLPIYIIQHSEEFFADPEKFDPERFMPDQKASLDPLGFVAFGLGPRNCIGMRFAEMELHIAISMLLHRFHFKPGPNTPKLPLKLEAHALLKPVDQLVVLAERI